MYAVDNLSAYGILCIGMWEDCWSNWNGKMSKIVCTPYLLPIPRGILSTIYATFKEKKSGSDVEAR